MQTYSYAIPPCPYVYLLNYDGFEAIPEFAWDSIAKIRNVIFDFLSIEKNNDYILTNCLFENDGDRELYLQVESMALKRGSVFVPVKLLISETEHLKRITEPSRGHRLKSINPEDIYSDEELLSIEHKNYLELDVSDLAAVEVMERILRHAQMISL